jgi:cytochrome c2
MQELRNSGFMWTEQNLSRYMEGFGGFLAGTKPGVYGLPNKQDREDVIAYLRKAGG